MKNKKNVVNRQLLAHGQKFWQYFDIYLEFFCGISK